MATGFRRRWRTFARISRQLISTVTQHHTILLAAGVAFYSALAVVPTLVAVVAVYGLVAEEGDVRGQLEPITEALPTEAGDLIVSQLESVTAQSSAEITIGLVFGFVGAIWLISNAMNAIVMSVRIAHERRSPHNWVQGRVFAIGLSLAAIVVVASLLWLAVALPEFTEDENLGSRTERLIEIGRWPVILSVTGFSTASLYRAVVGTRPKSRLLLTAGALSAMTIWVAGTFGLSLFAANFGRFESTFGSLSAVVVLFFWVYLAAFAVLIGAEIDALLDRWIQPRDDPQTGPFPQVELN